MTGFLIAGIVITLIGILLIVTRKAKKSRCTSTTMAKIVDFDREKTQSYNSSRDMQYGNSTNISIGNMNIGLARNNYDYNTVFYPIIEYQVGDKKYVKKSSSGSSSPTFAIGDETEVHYNPNDPNEFYLTESGPGIMIGVVFTIVGIIFIGAYISTLFA